MLALIESRILALIESGTVASIGFLTGAQPAASRAAESRRAAAQLHDHATLVVRCRDTKLQHQQRADRAATSR